jgi:hypothetical protein
MDFGSFQYDRTRYYKNRLLMKIQNLPWFSYGAVYVVYDILGNIWKAYESYEDALDFLKSKKQTQAKKLDPSDDHSDQYGSTSNPEQCLGILKKALTIENLFPTGLDSCLEIQRHLTNPKGLLRRESPQSF